MYALVEELFPICRSITGEGVRRTLSRLGAEIPIRVHEVETGTRVFDWTVPREWNIREAWVRSASGEVVVDFADSNLHVVSYSVPVHRKLSLDELQQHLHSVPEHPDWIPYRTSYYQESWGFCLPHRRLERLEPGEYEVRIDSTLEPGHLTYGECVLEGETDAEVLLSCHCCHPSLANDNLSGIALAVALARRLGTARRRYTYRILFIPGTIGSIAWLARNEEDAARIEHGLVLTCVGDDGGFTYKRSRSGHALVDRAAEHALRHSGVPFEITPFTPYGYDERQYCSPGFDLPVGCFMRSANGTFPEYHTSADDLDFVSPERLSESYRAAWRLLEIVEKNDTYVNLSPKCEPQLGRRGLYGPTGGEPLPGYQMALLWVLNLSDGSHDLLEIADRAEIPFATVHQAAMDLAEHELLAVAP
jgi:aminopeptidase-like protein